MRSCRVWQLAGSRFRLVVQPSLADIAFQFQASPEGCVFLLPPVCKRSKVPSLQLLIASPPASQTQVEVVPSDLPSACAPTRRRDGAPGSMIPTVPQCLAS